LLKHAILLIKSRRKHYFFDAPLGKAAKQCQCFQESSWLQLEYIAFSSLSVTFYDFSRRNLQTPQTPKQKSNPKQTLQSCKFNCFSSIRQEKTLIN